ncbi:MAG TPA: hypothetical protein VN253_15165 [Kofleriaceae bacterium]|nr:hypothetical protein [Kofleriaceae bacterium]
MKPETDWIAEHPIIWVLANGERLHGRLALGRPFEVEGARDEWRFRALYAVEPFHLPQGFGQFVSTMEALYFAARLLGRCVFELLASGVRAARHPDGDPEEGAALLLALLGPLIRDDGDLRGVADPSGRLADIEALAAKILRRDG